MNLTKPWYQSAGLWGALASVLVSLLSLLKMPTDANFSRDLSDWLLQSAGCAAGFLALWGRARASARLSA